MELGFWRDRAAARQAADASAASGRMALLGLPGNPVSSLVCAVLFLRPGRARAPRRSGGRGRSDRTGDPRQRLPARTTGARTICARRSRRTPDGAARGDTLRAPGFLDARHPRRAPTRSSSARRTRPPPRPATPAGSSGLNRFGLKVFAANRQPRLRNTAGTLWCSCFVSESLHDRELRASHADAQTARTAPLHPRAAARERGSALLRRDEGRARPQVEIRHPSPDHRARGARLHPPPAQPGPGARGHPPARDGRRRRQASAGSRRASSRAASTAEAAPRPLRRPHADETPRDHVDPGHGADRGRHADLGDPEPQPHHHHVAGLPRPAASTTPSRCAAIRWSRPASSTATSS